MVSQAPGLADVKLGMSSESPSKHIYSTYPTAGLAGSHQYQNASLAVHLAKKFITLQTSQPIDDDLPPVFVEGLKSAKWPGRCQTVADPSHAGTTWFLDGAHTLESLQCCMQWYVSPDVALRASEQPYVS